MQPAVPVTRCWPVVALISLAATSARADGAADLNEGQALFSRGLFTEAIPALDRAARADELGLEQRAEALQALGVIYVALGDDFESRRSFARLLAITPNTRLPDTLPPKVHRVFEDVRRLMLGVTGIGLKHRAIQATLGEPLRPITIEIDAIEAADIDARMYLRRRGEERFREFRFAAGGKSRELTLAPDVLGPLAAGETFEYYFEALNSTGETAGRVGGPRAPLVFEVVPPTTDTPFWRRGWFWASVGATVVASATAAYLATRDRDAADSPCTGALDCVQAP